MLWHDRKSRPTTRASTETSLNISGHLAGVNPTQWVSNRRFSATNLEFQIQLITSVPPHYSKHQDSCLTEHPNNVYFGQRPKRPEIAGTHSMPATHLTKDADDQASPSEKCIPSCCQVESRPGINVPCKNATCFTK